MKINSWFLGICFSVLALPLGAQNYMDVLRFSSKNGDGDAQWIGTGGAMSAVGANPSATTNNPAGLGFYRQTELGLSLGIFNQAITSTYLASESSGSRMGLYIPNISFVTSTLKKPLGKETDKDVISYTFAFQHNRSHNFGAEMFYQGRNRQSSMLDAFYDESNGFFSDELRNREYLAYDVYLLNPRGSSQTEYTIPVSEGDRNAVQSGNIVMRGGRNDYSASGAFNYGNKLYVGANLFYSVQTYKEVNEYREDNDLSLDGFKDMTYTTDLNARGVGYGAIIGIIFKPLESIRLGASIQLPTTFKFKDVFSESMAASFDPRSSFVPPVLNPNSAIEDMRSEYSILTPARYNFSMAVVDGSFGFVNLEFEHVDYSTSSLSSEFFNTLVDNSLIRTEFRSVTSFKLGTELINDDMRFRFGLGYNPSPFNQNFVEYENLRRQWVFSGGIGFVRDDFRFDVGLTQSRFKDTYLPYTTQDPEFPYSSVSSLFRATRLVATMVFVLK